jgi:hypothetical protein
LVEKKRRGGVEERRWELRSCEEFVVPIEVAFGGGVPREVAEHGLSDDVEEGCLLLPEVDGLLDDASEGEWGGFFKEEACAGELFGVDHFDGIGETAGASDDGEGSVAHGVHLDESAGFEEAGHEAEVGASEDTVCEGLVEEEAGLDVIGVLFHEGAEAVFEARIASAEEDKAGVEIPKLWRDLGDHLDAFLRGEAGDDAEDGAFVVDFPTEFLLEGLAAALFTAEVVGVEMSGEGGLMGGIPDLVVDTIEDTDDLGASRPEDALEAVSEAGFFNDFISIGWADGVDPVGKGKTGFHEVEVSVEFKGAEG